MTNEKEDSVSRMRSGDWYPDFVSGQKWTIGFIPRDNLEISQWNPRDHLDYEITRVKESIERCGLLQPLVAVKLGNKDKYQVLIGGTRLRALEEMKYDGPVPCIIRDSESPRDYLINLSIEDNTARRNLKPGEVARAVLALREAAATAARREGKKVVISEEMLAIRLGYTKSEKRRLFITAPVVEFASKTGKIGEWVVPSQASLDDVRWKDNKGYLTTKCLMDTLWPFLNRKLLGLDDEDLRQEEMENVRTLCDLIHEHFLQPLWQKKYRNEESVVIPHEWFIVGCRYHSFRALGEVLAKDVDLWPEPKTPLYTDRPIDWDEVTKILRKAAKIDWMHKDFMSKRSVKYLAGKVTMSLKQIRSG